MWRRNLLKKLRSFCPHTCGVFVPTLATSLGRSGGESLWNWLRRASKGLPISLYMRGVSRSSPSCFLQHFALVFGGDEEVVERAATPPDLSEEKAYKNGPRGGEGFLLTSYNFVGWVIEEQSEKLPLGRSLTARNVRYRGLAAPPNSRHRLVTFVLS